MRSLAGTAIFSGIFLGICFIFIRFLPGTKNSEGFTEQNRTSSSTFSSDSQFSTYSLMQNARSGVEIAEMLDIKDIDEIVSLGLDAAFGNASREKTQKETGKEGTAENDDGLRLYRQAGTKPLVEWFYTRVTNNKDVALAILENADKNDIPTSLAFALAYVESKFKPNAVNKNTNSTIDRGLFQLNNATFPNLTEEQFFDPWTSAKFGMAHLKFCLETAGNEITALAMYNAGTTRVKNDSTPQHTLNYVSQISKYRKNLEQRFSTEIIANFDTENTLASAK